ncbi:MAG TPA: ATP-binding protein [Vicinamibacterales bacterium]|nr:ATP-binding protein [Vicinamibacterales bacterium]
MDESARLAALRRYRILDTEPEQAFDDLTLLASQICGAPMAALTLIDEDRQWFKSKIGLTASETARNVSFCTHAIQDPDEIMVVPNALVDLRFSSNPLVQDDPRIRFYAGAPLVTGDGHALGTLCVLDSVPRTLTPDQIQALDALRRQAQAQLELRLHLRELEDALAERTRAEQAREALITELRESLEQVNKLADLMEFCSTCQMNLTVPAVPSSIQTVSDGVTQILSSKGWKEEDILKVDLALQEALANGIRHGAKNDPSKFIQCIVSTDPSGELVVVVRDPGSGFDPSKVANPLDAENILKSSGRGVFLINQLMDDVAFADGGREVQMRKRKEA